jgi:hypothetical protein
VETLCLETRTRTSQTPTPFSLLAHPVRQRIRNLRHLVVPFLVGTSQISHFLPSIGGSQLGIRKAQPRGRTQIRNLRNHFLAVQARAVLPPHQRPLHRTSLRNHCSVVSARILLVHQLRLRHRPHLRPPPYSSSRLPLLGGGQINPSHFNSPPLLPLLNQLRSMLRNQIQLLERPPHRRQQRARRLSVTCSTRLPQPHPLLQAQTSSVWGQLLQQRQFLRRPLPPQHHQ